MKPCGLGRSFYIGMAILAIVIVLVSFGPSLVIASTRVAPLTTLVAVHGSVFLLWFLLFLTQAALVAAGRIADHRRLGTAGPALAGVALILGVLASLQMARRGFDLSGDLGGATVDVPLLLALQFGDIALFGILVAAAIGYRHRPEIHKRLMLLATVSPYTLMGAPLAHLRGHWAFLGPVSFIVFLVLMFSGAIYDRVSTRRIHPLSLWGPVLLFAWGVVRGAIIYPSRPWLEFAAWVTG